MVFDHRLRLPGFGLSFELRFHLQIEINFRAHKRAEAGPAK